VNIVYKPEFSSVVILYPFLQLRMRMPGGGGSRKKYIAMKLSRGHMFRSVLQRRLFPFRAYFSVAADFQEPYKGMAYVVKL
jgi:hypothetical protein